MKHTQGEGGHNVETCPCTGCAITRHARNRKAKPTKAQTGGQMSEYKGHFLSDGIEPSKRERKQGRTVSAYLNYEERQAFDKQADKEQVSENQIIKKALREYLEREGK